MPRSDTALRTIRFALGVWYLLWLSNMLARLFDVPDWQGLAAATLSFLVTFVVGMILAVRLATSGAERPQFRLSSMLLLLLLVSVYFALLRWLLMSSGRLSGQSAAQAWLSTAGACAVLLAWSLPCWLLLSEALMWFAAWLVHRPPIQRLLRLLARR